MNTTKSDLIALAAVIGLIGLSVFSGWQAHKASVKPDHPPTLETARPATTNLKFTVSLTTPEAAAVSQALNYPTPSRLLYPISINYPGEPRFTIMGVFTNYTYDSKVVVSLRIAAQGQTNDVPIWTQWRDEVDKMLGRVP